MTVELLLKKKWSIPLKNCKVASIQERKKAVEEPIKIIAHNSGAEGAVILDEIKKKKGDWGFDADALKFGNMFEMGIIDPAKVTRAAMENAASVASMILTTESLITDIKEKQPAMPPAPPMDY